MKTSLIHRLLISLGKFPAAGGVQWVAVALRATGRAEIPRCLLRGSLLALIGAVIGFSPSAFGQDTTDMLSKALDLVHQVESPPGNPPTDAQRIDLLTQAITMAQQAPNHRLKGHRVLAIQAIRGAIAEIGAGDPNHQAATYLHTADTELGASIELAGGPNTTGATIANPPPTTNAPTAAPSASIVPNAFAEIMNAAENDDLDKVKALLQENPGLVSSKDKDGLTPLDNAAGGGHKDVAEWLLIRGADVNAKDNTGQTPLHFAAQDDSTDVAELLLAKGADIGARDINGDTPLLDAVKGGNEKMTEFLLAKGANIEAKDNSGCTPLIWAAIEGYKALAELLLAHNADVNATSSCGQTPLNSAAMNGHRDVAEVLLAHHADLHARAKDGQTPLDWAVDNGRLDMVKFLLAQGADLNAKANDGSTPLRLAELNHNYDVATYLRQHGGQEPVGVTTGTLPQTGDASTDPATLEAAARAGDLGKVKALLKGDPNSLFDTAGGQYAPLVAAAWSDHKDVVEFLLANHADINARDSLDMTALSHAATEGRKDMAEFLLANKADPNIGDNSGLTPLFQASLMGRKEMVELLLAHGANVNARGKDGTFWAGDTPLYITACNGSAEVAKVLLAHGADANARGHDGLTPLEIAVKNHHDTAEVPENDVADLLRPHSQKPSAPAADALPPGVTPEMEQAFLTKYKAALEKPDADALFSLVAVDPDMDAKAKEDLKGLVMFGFAMDASNPNRTYSFVPVTPGQEDKPSELDGKMYGDYLPAVVALKTTFAEPAHPSPDGGEAVGDSIMPLGIKDRQLMFVGAKEIPGAVPPPAVDKAANFGIEPNLRKLSDKGKWEDRDAFTSLDEFLSSLKQPAVQILDSGESTYEYYALCRIAPNLCVWAGGDKVGERNYTFYFKATDSNKQELNGSQKWIRLVDVPTDNGQAPNVQGTVFFVPDRYSGPITVEANYGDDSGKKVSFSRTIDWK
jgi:cytohesin